MPKDAKEVIAIDDNEKKWQTESDFDALKCLAEVKRDPERKKRLIAHVKEQNSEFVTYSDAYLKSIGL